MAETLNISNFPASHSSNNSQKISIVLIHGWGLNSAVWQPLIDSLPDSFIATFNIITVDLPGFGMNVSTEIQPYSLANICQCINRSIDQPAIYLGWSLGGLVATEMSLRFPAKVLGLVTVASSPRFLEEETIDNGDKQEAWPGIKPLVLNAFYKQLQVDTKKTISGFLKIQAMGSPHIRQDIKQISQLVFQHKMANKDTLDKSLKLLETSDYREQLKGIVQPFLRIYGGADSLVPKGVIEKVSKLAATSEQQVIKQASHAPFISHTDEFKTILFDWLASKAISNVS